MVKEKYIPDTGDIIVLDIGPTKGHEQHGRRPVLVLSEKSLNNYTGLAIVCPITSSIRNFKWQIRINDNQKTKGVIMCEQIKTIDYNIRNCQYKEKLNEDDLKQVKRMIGKIIKIDLL